MMFKFNFLYEDSMSLWDKVDSIAKNIYGASEIVADKNIRNQFKSFEEAGFGKFPICMAKTQYSFSENAELLGAPVGHILNIREIEISAGAGFIVPLLGDVMRMPGLPAVPNAELIDIDNNGYSDLIVAREDGVMMYLNRGNGKFDIRRLLDKSTKTIPIALTVSDYNKDGNVDIYVSQSVNPNYLK